MIDETLMRFGGYEVIVAPSMARVPMRPWYRWRPWRRTEMVPVEILEDGVVMCDKMGGKLHMNERTWAEIRKKIRQEEGLYGAGYDSR